MLEAKVDQNDEILARNNPASAFTRIALSMAPSMLEAEGVPMGQTSEDEKLTLETLAPIVEEAVALGDRFGCRPIADAAGIAVLGGEPDGHDPGRGFATGQRGLPRR